MYQDGYLDRRNFFSYCEQLIKEFSDDDSIFNFLEEYRIEYPSDFTVLFMFFMKLTALNIKDYEKLRINLYKIIQYLDICFDIVHPEYHKIFVEQFYSILLFLINEDKFQLIEKYNFIFSSVLQDKYLNCDFIIYFGYIALTQIQSVVSLYNNIVCFYPSDLTKLSNGIAILEKELPRVYSKLELEPSEGTEWYKYGE